MNQDLAAKLLQLVALLQDETAPVEWDEAAELLTDFPGSDYILSRLRHQGVPMFSVLFGRPGSRYEHIDTCFSPAKRKALLLEILPYSFLLDERYSSLERACLIQEAGYDAVKFCEAVLSAGNGYYRDRRFGDAASEALLVIAEHQNLLRGSERPNIPEKELLRAARAGATRDDSLLHSSEAPPAPEQNMGLLSRIKQKRFFVKE